MSSQPWQIGTVEAVVPETPRVKTLVLRLPRWVRHRAGQHYILRLTAPDGYQAQRSYSIASPPEQTGQVAFTIELIDDGEVSGYLFDTVAPGDPLEVRGPLGGYFVWEATPQAGPLLLVAGGSGVVPLMAMLRHRQQVGVHNATVLLYSCRTPDDVIYHRELSAMAHSDPTFRLLLTFTRQAPPQWPGYQRRIDTAMLAEVVRQFASAPLCYVCGPTALVEQVADGLLAQGLAPETIRTERFGPTGT